MSYLNGELRRENPGDGYAKNHSHNESQAFSRFMNDCHPVNDNWDRRELWVWVTSSREKKMTYFANGNTSVNTCLNVCQAIEVIVRMRRVAQSQAMIVLMTRSFNPENQQKLSNTYLYVDCLKILSFPASLVAILRFLPWSSSSSCWRFVDHWS